MGEAKFRTPTLPKYGGNRFNRYKSEHALKMRFCLIFLLKYPSLYLSINAVFSRGYRSHFGTILMCNCSNDMFLQPLVPFGGLDNND